MSDTPIVTDDMVERGAIALFCSDIHGGNPQAWPHVESEAFKNTLRGLSRAILTAALDDA